VEESDDSEPDSAFQSEEDKEEEETDNSASPGGEEHDDDSEEDEESDPAGSGAVVDLALVALRKENKERCAALRVSVRASATTIRATATAALPTTDTELPAVRGFVSKRDGKAVKRLVTAICALRHQAVKNELFSSVEQMVQQILSTHRHGWFEFTTHIEARGQQGIPVVYVQHRGESMVRTLTDDIKISDHQMTEDPNTGEAVTMFACDSLFAKIDAIVALAVFEIKAKADQRSDFLPSVWTDFCTQLLSHYKQHLQEKSTRCSDIDSLVTFKNLRTQFAKDDHVVTKQSGQDIAMQVTEVVCDARFIVWKGVSLQLHDNGQISEKQVMHAVPAFTGGKTLASLGIRLVIDKEKEELAARGQRVLDLALDRPWMHLHYKGTYTYNFNKAGKESSVQSVMRQSVDSTRTIDGRVMIDRAMFYMRTKGAPSSAAVPVSSSFKGGAEANLHLMWPFLRGFDLHGIREWGQFYIDNLSPVQYREKAFDRLIIPDASVKPALEAVLSDFEPGKMQDIVGQHKNSGRVLLLSGEPGTGKTLTAEASAELLKLPLYYLTTGSLGVHGSEIEAALNEALDLAIRWKAIVLLDEADCFLEARNATDIGRNAVVGTFLHALEHFSGILFMTTNRVQSFDRAALTRVHVTLHFENLDIATRTKIWQDMITDAGYPHYVDCGTKMVGASPCNGRQLRTLFQIARSLATRAGLPKEEPFKEEHILAALKLNVLAGKSSSNDVNASAAASC